ncbi:hypothetical protein B0H19DRAFT_1258330 [Mycena capillaripes]|nr:hypothetical protein B0H19DRAFT_1258330 [Mycena capillaripes]
MFPRDKLSIRLQGTAPQLAQYTAHLEAFHYLLGVTVASRAGELLLRTFAAHLGAVKNCDVFYGHPVGALAIACAARALHMYKTGTCSTDGVKSRRKRSATSSVAVPWATRAKAYLPGIMKLSDQKWAKIIALAPPFIENAAQITADDTKDSHGLIVISDDSADVGAVQSIQSIREHQKSIP